MLKIKLTSVFVHDPETAHKFYTDILGFQTKMNLDMGEFKFITVVSPDAPNGVELLLEPNNNPIAKTYQAALFEQNIPAAAFNVDDIQAEYDKLTGLGVAFKSAPQASGPVIQAVFNDTCGNLIQLFQVQG
ncbi:VOC family protein [Mucilaginibacter phyllosphaerae]|uniref:Catechol 2,3-dioxygenase-like lactoylglutathione lyase family enzyme n=1 Tax=Mucilaginibacter phyllosphaerae TaxID=1812349 RepID=A0A4Y8AJD4_9SPHI|nr:VOC family protein [Mucilaginibacter phyllosphaerae]MBB3968382.1 catechol 2,3-dioxygenase-like lactoylglutathione lyase family enzyme [Mucilaginibacter phyllosphaerae]TEW68621.1 VOC family protein [Mucilaginibacter phyllosphaerae]GGG99315.1 hypothetical protein GCM10007352_00100 [Mucilaginibacter phyllosphaerae]